MRVVTQPCQARERQRGFTLLEVLIAIVITAMIGIGANQILGQAIETSQKTRDKLEALNTLQKTMLVLARDFRQVVPRSVRDEYGDFVPAFSTQNEDYTIEFTRAGWRNPLGDLRSDMQRVAYSVEDGKLQRWYWMTLDRSHDNKPFQRTMLEGVEEFELRFLNQSNGWVDEWPPQSVSSPTPPVDRMAEFNHLPIAVELRMKHSEFGQIRKVYDLVSYLEATPHTPGSGGGAGGGAGTGNGTNGGAGPVSGDTGQGLQQGGQFESF